MDQDFPLEDPDFDAASAVGGESSRDPVIDVGTQSVQRNAALAVPLHARDFSATETARAVNPDALGAETHRRLYCALHGAPEGHAALELLGNRFGDELGIEL